MGKPPVTLSPPAGSRIASAMKEGFGAVRMEDRLAALKSRAADVDAAKASAIARYDAELANLKHQIAAAEKQLKLQAKPAAKAAASKTRRS